MAYREILRFVVPDVNHETADFTLHYQKKQAVRKHCDAGETYTLQSLGILGMIPGSVSQVATKK